MKLEKREVTLNEKDSIKDVLAFERTLLLEYISLSTVLDGTERRETLIGQASDTLRNIFRLVDILKENIGSESEH